MPARLTFHFNDRPQHVVELIEGDDSPAILIGRDPTCGVVLDDERLSRKHARLRWRSGDWLLEDLESKNGTVIDGRNVDSVELTQATWISFGGQLARFERLSPQQAAEATHERLARWQTSIELQRRLDPKLGLDELLRRLMRGVQRISATERAFVLLRDGSDELTVAASRGLTLLDIEDPQFSGSLGAVDLALAERRAVVLSDVAQDPRVGGRPSVVGGGIRTLICLPLDDGDRTLGVLYADAQRTSRSVDELDVEILQALANHASLAIAVARLREETRALGEIAAGEEDLLAGRSWRQLQSVHSTSQGTYR